MLLIERLKPYKLVIDNNEVVIAHGKEIVGTWSRGFGPFVGLTSILINLIQENKRLKKSITTYKRRLGNSK